VDGIEPNWLSTVPALVTITLAFSTRRVVLALLAGVLSGSLVLIAGGQSIGEAEPFSRFFLPALISPAFAQILLIYLGCLGGLIGIWDRTGAARHFALVLGGKIARGPRTSLLYGWVLGCIFHQGGTVSTVLAGASAKPVTDSHRVSHEEIAYVVDSTASPVATILAFNVWPTYVAGLVVGAIPLIPDTGSAVVFFWKSVPYNFYALFAVLGTLLFSLGVLPWVGSRMAQARKRAREENALDAPGARPILMAGGATRGPEPGDYAPGLLDFALPVAVLISIAVLPMLILGQSFTDEAFLAALFSAIAVALIRGLPLREVGKGLIGGFRGMGLGVVVFALAVTLGTVSRELGTAIYAVGALGGAIPPAVLPPALMALCMVIGFSTGSSWGTYAVVFPIALPLAWSLNADPVYVQICFGAVLGGAVFGDQCSPISDTTILSSMFTGCDLLDHVRSQLPLACAIGAIAALCSTLGVIFLT